MKRRTRPSALIAIGVLLLFGSAKTWADDGYLVINTVALHLQETEGRNTVTPGLGLEYSPSGKLGFHAGTLSDSFGYRSYYGGLNYATPRYAVFDGRIRFILGATVLHKQFRVAGEPETKIVPLPAAEFAITRRAVLNVSGSPEIDFGEHSNNAVVFFQLKLNLL